MITERMKDFINSERSIIDSGNLAEVLANLEVTNIPGPEKGALILLIGYVLKGKFYIEIDDRSNVGGPQYTFYLEGWKGPIAQIVNYFPDTKPWGRSDIVEKMTKRLGTWYGESSSSTYRKILEEVRFIKR